MYACIRIRVCMYVCMYVHMYAFMCVYMYECMHNVCMPVCLCIYVSPIVSLKGQASNLRHIDTRPTSVSVLAI